MSGRTIAVLTATRAEYGLLRWLMSDIRDDKSLVLRTIVTGAHLSPAHGMTYEEIVRDGFEIDAKIDMDLSVDTPAAIAGAIGRCTAGVGVALADIEPDILVVLGDRYELLGAAAAATVAGIPIAHISGGDVTIGAMDNQIRHALTKLSHIHFPSTDESAARIIQMGEDPSAVHVVGEPGLDSFRRLPRVMRHDLAAEYGLDPKRPWAVFAYHPETAVSSRTNENRVESALDILSETGETQTVLTYPNSDPGWSGIARILEERAQKEPARFKLFKSMGQQVFISLMCESTFMMGNSSASVIEAPSAKLPVVNIGRRQAGRIMAANVIQSDGSADSIREAVEHVLDPVFRAALVGIENPYGDGLTAGKIKSVLADAELKGLVTKGFHEVHARDFT